MITEDDVEAIERGKKHCVLGQDARGFILECLICKRQWRAPEGPQELWVMEALAWGFSKEHADCGAEESEHDSGD